MRINATRLAAIHYLAPLIGPFQRAHPDITLDVVVEDRLVDIVAERFDAGIRLGEMVEKDMVAVKIGSDLEMMVVAAPSYIERFGMPETPRDLRRHRCINFRHDRDEIYRWEFDKGKRSLAIAVNGPLIVDDVELVIRAALDGVGLAYLGEDRAAPHLDSGALVRVLEQWCQPFPGFFLYYPSRRQQPAALSALIDALRLENPRK